MNYSLHHHDPKLRPDWRWERARCLQEDGQVRHPDDDCYIDAALAYQIEANECETAEDAKTLRQRFPGIYDAFQVRFNENDLPWTLEAFLLARADFNLIARLHKIHTEAVFFYEKLFFNLVPYLESELYILAAVMGEAVHTGLTDRDYPTIWKLVGYYGGPALLQAYIRPFHALRVSDEDQVDSAFLAALDREMRKKALKAGLTIPTFAHHEIIFNAYHQAQVIAQAKGGGNAQEQSCKENIHAAMLAFKDCFVVGSHPANLPLLQKYAQSRVELRPHEQMQLALGIETDEIKATQDWKFPDEKSAGSPKEQAGDA
jgi:hypothetical protein